MTDELKPVRCGCGGEAKVEEWVGRWYVRCKNANCLISTKNCDTEAEAVEVWNRAMGIAEKSSTVERTAKVKLQDICWEDIRRYKEGMCASCGRSVYDHAKYCDECGCRLEWND